MQLTSGKDACVTLLMNSRKYTLEPMPLAFLKSLHEENFKKAKVHFQEKAGFAFNEGYAQGT